AAPSLRQWRRGGSCDSARPVRGACAVRARCPLPALASNREDVPGEEPEATLLPFDGISHRPLTGKQRNESSALSADRRVYPRQETESDRDLRAGARRWSGKWRTWTFGRVLH